MLQCWQLWTNKSFEKEKSLIDSKKDPTSLRIRESMLRIVFLSSLVTHRSMVHPVHRSYAGGIYRGRSSRSKTSDIHVERRLDTKNLRVGKMVLDYK